MQLNNNVQSPNFGMALKINKGAQEALNKLPMETIEKLQKAGEELKDTKFYHVAVDNNLGAKITADKDAYFGLFRTKDYQAIAHGKTMEDGKLVPDKNIIMIADNRGNSIYGVGRYLHLGESKPFFNAWGLYPLINVQDVTSLANIAKILDDAAITKYEELATKQAAEISDKAEVSKVVVKLLDTFGE